MDIKAILEKIKTKFAEIKDIIVNWVKNNKKLSIIIAALLVLMIICIIILIAVSGKDKKEDIDYQNRIELTQDLVIPKGPELPRDYTISRETQENWSEEEAEKWFTVPSDKEINNLSKANDNMVDEILGAAP